VATDGLWLWLEADIGDFRNGWAADIKTEVVKPTH
jgi:hypothetical protein